MKSKTAPNHLVCYESYDTFSAWPILFGQADPVGLYFDSQTNLELPLLDKTMINFTFWAKESGRANPRPASLMSLMIAVVLQWRKAKEGLWVRAGFSEPLTLDKTLPVRSIQDRLRIAMKENRLAMTYATHTHSKHRTRLRPREDGSQYVEHFPLLAFSLYEMPKELPDGFKEETLPTGIGLPTKQ